jgi:hypothetical protein
MTNGLKEHRPKTARQLEKDGKLDQIVLQLAEMAVAAHSQAQAAGLSPDQARELEFAAWALPDEETAPNLDLHEILGEPESLTTDTLPTRR